MNKTRFAAATTRALLVGALAASGVVAAAQSAMAATGAGKMALAPFEASLKDKPSLQRGARLFVNYCLSCHSAKYMRYNRMARDLEIPTELVERNMMFTADRIGDPMETTMSEEHAREWFGVAPPDLSLIGRLRGGTWLYNYFRAFYLDENSPSGWNNAVFENVAMPHAMHELQGLQRAVFKTETGPDGATREVLDYFEPTASGKMTAQEYEQAARDLTNFLMYLGEPGKLKRIRYGLWVMLFLAVFAVLAWALKKEYWRDVEQGRSRQRIAGKSQQ